MSKTILTSILFLFITSVNAQYIQLRAKTFTINLNKKADSLNLEKRSYIAIDTITYLIQDEQRAINIGVFDLSPNTIFNSKPFFIHLYDKKKKSTKAVEHAKLYKNKDSLIINVASSNNWQKIKQVLLSNTQFVKNSKNKTYPFSIKYTDKTKQIGMYLCKHAIVSYGDDLTDIWYTESINYNWIFSSYFYKIPGTVILAISKSGETIFEFIEIKSFDNSNLVIKNWD